MCLTIERQNSGQQLMDAFLILLPSIGGTLESRSFDTPGSLAGSDYFGELTQNQKSTGVNT
jgi:hypothetical protein